MTCVWTNVKTISEVAGVNTEYPNRSLGIKTCFSDCNCNIYDYQPVCGEDNVTYFSPCLAGCKTSSELKVVHFYNFKCLEINFFYF